MRILQLCKKFPFPLKDGESIAVTYLAKAMKQLGCEVTLLAMNTTKHPVAVNRIKPHLSHYESVHYTKLDNEIKPLHVFLNLFTSDSYNISRFDNATFRRKLKTLLKKKTYDVVQLESLYLTPYIDIIRAHSKARIILRAHNVEHEIWSRMASNEMGPLRRWYLEYSAKKLRSYEISQLQSIDYLLPISEIDAKKFKRLGYKGLHKTVPIGLDLETISFESVKVDTPLSISFIGSLDWMPNLEGLNWFLEQIWPHLNAIFPKLSLHVAGRNCPDWIQNLQVKNLEVYGEIEDASHFLKQHPITVVPLLSGSGIRAKIIEAMALGRIVITTSIGLEGIHATDKREVLIANTPSEFIRKFRFCHHHLKHLSTLSHSARRFAEVNFDHLNIGQGLLTSMEQTLTTV